MFSLTYKKYILGLLHVFSCRNFRKDINCRLRVTTLDYRLLKTQMLRSHLKLPIFFLMEKDRQKSRNDGEHESRTKFVKSANGNSFFFV